MFLVGGPAFSGTTLLAHLLNQNGVVCLDEPDFHNPRQSHRGIPVLQKLFPGRIFPARPEQEMSYGQAVDMLEQCQRVIHPVRLGMKTCNQFFIEYAGVYRKRGYPVLAIVRDIRDALVNPPPDFVGEAGLNQRYQLIWKHQAMYNLLVRYEDLVRKPEEVMEKISRALGLTLQVRKSWDPESVPPDMLKYPRHDRLLSGRLDASRVGIWRAAGLSLSAETRETARQMGYE